MAGFGGFGSSGFAATTSAFGNTGFGSNTSTASGFGVNKPTPSIFGNPATTPNSGFGKLMSAPSSNSLQMQRNNPSTIGSFGSNNNNKTTSSPFGSILNPVFGSSANTSSATPGFGTNAATSGSAFSQGGFGAAKSSFGTPSTGFGTPSGPSAPFGSSTSNNNPTGFTANTSVPFGAGNSQNNGTAHMLNFTGHRDQKEKDLNPPVIYKTISAQYPKFSLQEYRLVDYAQGRKYSNNSGQAGAFAQSSNLGNFPQSSTFNNTNNTNTSAAPSLFNKTQPSTGFNLNQPSTGNTTTSIFSNANSAPKPFAFPNMSNSTSFASNNNNNNNNNNNTTNAGGGFANTPTAPSIFNQSSNTANTNTPFAPSKSIFTTTNNNLGTANPMFPQSTQSTSTSIFPPSTAVQPQNQQPSNPFFSNSQSTTNPMFAAPQTSSLFAPTQALPHSIFGPQQQQQQQQQPNPLQQFQPALSQAPALIASLDDNPYGQPQLFASLNGSMQSLGASAIALSASKPKKQAVIPQHRIAPNASLRLMTPQKIPSAYGFSYSTYNSPNTSAYNSPLANGSSLPAMQLSTSIARSLGKSFSTSNLRVSYTANEHVISPNAFGSMGRNVPGSMKKLHVDRGIASPRSFWGGQDKNAPVIKQVSFQTTTSPLSSPSPTMSGALIRIENDEYDNNNMAYTKISPKEHKQTEKETLFPAVDKYEPPEGYSISPSLDEIRDMSPQELCGIENLRVSREGFGNIVFSKVDLTGIDTEKIMGDIVEINLRSAAVYDSGRNVKPPEGQGLNVPSIITLEQSWPRSRPKSVKLNESESSEAAYRKHVKLLKAQSKTVFESYNRETGTWVFRVPHYTTYDLNYDCNDESIASGMMFDQVTNSHDEEMVSGFAPSTPSLRGSSSNSSSEESLEDTFEFRFGRQHSLPGQFYDTELIQNRVARESRPTEPLIPQETNVVPNAESLVHADADADADAPNLSVMQGTSHVSLQPTEILENGMLPIHGLHTPTKTDPFVLGTNWTQQLLQTASPKKLDRQALREQHTQAPPDTLLDRQPLKPVGFGTSVDIMKSLFPGPQTARKNTGIEVRAHLV